MAIRHFLSTGDIEILCSGSGYDLNQRLSSFTYNAAINAFELRGPRMVDMPDETDLIPDLTRESPLIVKARGAVMYRVYFETITRVPVEMNIGRDEGPAYELVILRGVRIEM